MDKTQIKISVVTVCYNAADCIEETMLSVLDQTYPNIEYIVIDGGSSDGTADVIRKYADRLAYWVSEPDKGIYDAMNKGIVAATGDYINFMNAGDRYIDSYTIEKILTYHKTESILYGNIIRCFSNRKEVECGITKPVPTIIDFIGNTIHHQAAFIKRSLFAKYGYYSLDYKLISDWKFFLDSVALHHESILYVNQNVAYFQMDGISSNHKDLYLAESDAYLNLLLGNEIYNNLKELKLYRSCRLSAIPLKLKKIFLASAAYKGIRNTTFIAGLRNFIKNNHCQ